MPMDNPHLEAVLLAAEAILSAREDQMLTTQEWSDLAEAVAACREPGPHERTEAFSVEGGDLVRSVTPTRGEPYQHRCPLDTFEAVAHAIDEATEPFNLEDLRSAAGGQPSSQVAVALAFLKERSIVVPAYKRQSRAANPGGTHLDAMTEYHALREEPRERAQEPTDGIDHP